MISDLSRILKFLSGKKPATEIVQPAPKPTPYIPPAEKYPELLKMVEGANPDLHVLAKDSEFFCSRIQEMIKSEGHDVISRFMCDLPVERRKMETIDEKAYYTEVILSAKKSGTKATLGALRAIKKENIPFDFLLPASKVCKFDCEKVREIYDLTGYDLLRQTVDERIGYKGNFSEGVEQVIKNDKVRELISKESDPLIRAYLICITGQPYMGDNEREIPHALEYALMLMKNSKHLPLEEIKKGLRKGISDIDFMRYGAS